MALHESTAQAGSVHTWVWPAKPEGAQSGGCNLASGDPFSPTYPPGRTAFGAAAGTAHSRPTSGAGQSQSGTTSPMRMHVQTRARGIALIIVMLVIVALGVLAAELAYLMKVEMKLARNVDSEGELEWLGRSGVELARYVLAQQLNIPAEAGFTALNQEWAG